MSIRANPGPEYLRADEWGAIRSRRSRKRLAVTAGVVLLAAALGAWWVQAPGLRASAELRGAARLMETVRNSQISAYTLGPDEERTAVWHEWRVADRSRLQIERTGAVIIHGEGQDLAYDPYTTTTRDDLFAKRDVDGRKLVGDLLKRALEAPTLERLPTESIGGRPMHPYRFEQGRERFVIWIDEVSGNPTSCFVEVRTPDGWIPTLEFAVDLASPIPAGLLGYIPPEGGARFDLTDPRNTELEPKRVVAEVPIGERGAIRFGAVEMNKEGVLFLVVHTSSPLQPTVTDDLGTVYFRDDDVHTWPSIPATEYLFVPMERPQGEFKKRTLTIRFPARSSSAANRPTRDLATYEVTFHRPSCTAAPLYRQVSPGSDYEALYETEAVRGMHLARVMRTPNGRPIDTLGQGSLGLADRMQRATVNPEDLFAAARSYRRALALYRESGVYSGPTPATLWFRLFELTQSHGEEEDARRMILSAKAALLDSVHEPLGDEIRLNARKWTQTRPSR